jgi:RimJ/RimL family protein N-acetyltransferase
MGAEVRVLEIRESVESDVREFIAWRYEPPYDVYNISDDPAEAVAYFLSPATGCHTLVAGAVISGFFTLGADGQVPGGDYSQDALDIGMGIRPDLTGAGDGGRFVEAVVKHVVEQFQPPLLRVTIAAGNIRAQRVWTRAGFSEASRFETERSMMGSNQFRVFTLDPQARRE